MKDYSNYRPPASDMLIWSGIKAFEKQLETDGDDVLIDGVATRAIIKTHSNPYNENKEDRKFLCSLDTVITKGSVVDYDGFKWIIVADIDKNESYKYTKIIKTTNTLTFYKTHVSSTPIEIPYVVMSNINLYNMGEDSSKYLNIPDANIIIIVPNTDITRNIKRNDIYKLTYDNYEVVDMNFEVMQGLIVIKMKWSEQEQVIPDISEPITGYSVTISGSTSITKDSSKTYNCMFKNDDVIITENSTFYLTADDGISETTLAQITSQDSINNTCIVKGNSFGYVKLWSKNNDSSIISEAFRIQIKNVF